MKKTFAFVLGLLLFICPFAVLTEQIPDAHAPEPMSEEALNYLLSEDTCQGTLSWKGNKASTKFNYDMRKDKNK